MGIHSAPINLTAKCFCIFLRLLQKLHFYANLGLNLSAFFNFQGIARICDNFGASDVSAFSFVHLFE